MFFFIIFYHFGKSLNLKERKADISSQQCEFGPNRLLFNDNIRLFLSLFWSSCMRREIPEISCAKNIDNKFRGRVGRVGVGWGGWGGGCLSKRWRYRGPKRLGNTM
jgi:hypothetical protein